jgi:hypothetical protein
MLFLFRVFIIDTKFLKGVLSLCFASLVGQKFFLSSSETMMLLLLLFDVIDVERAVVLCA